jgi:protein FAM32A
MSSGYDNVLGGRLVLKGGWDLSSRSSIGMDSKKNKKNKREKRSKRDGKEKMEEYRRPGDDGTSPNNKSNEGEPQVSVTKRRRCEVVGSDGAYAETGKAHMDDEEGIFAGLTSAQRKFELKRREREQQQVVSMIGKTHREKIDEFNEKLSKLTEHNDLPRISAAGNG